ncbi:hypothetical protein KKE78_02625 [Patescibacteria group bacterium]|nr:hypothetical protein [Patescibacteria group bacterium]
MAIDTKAETVETPAPGDVIPETITYPSDSSRRLWSRREFGRLTWRIAKGGLAMAVSGGFLGAIIKREELAREGKKIWQNLLDSSYHPFSETFDTRENTGSISTKNALSVSSNEARGLNSQIIDGSRVIILVPFTPPEGVNIKYYRDLCYIPPLPSNMNPQSADALSWTQKQQAMYKEQGILNQVTLFEIPAGIEFLAPADGKIIISDAATAEGKKYPNGVISFTMIIPTPRGDIALRGLTNKKTDILVSTASPKFGSGADTWVMQNGLYVSTGTPLFRFQQPEGTAEVRLIVVSPKIPGKTEGDPFRLDFAAKDDKVVALHK